MGVTLEKRVDALPPAGVWNTTRQGYRKYLTDELLSFA